MSDNNNNNNSNLYICHYFSNGNKETSSQCMLEICVHYTIHKFTDECSRSCYWGDKNRGPCSLVPEFEAAIYNANNNNNNNNNNNGS